MTAAPTPDPMFESVDAAPVTVKPTKGNWRAVAALLYGPDYTLNDLAGGQLGDEDYNPGPYRRSRRLKPSKLPKSVLRSKALGSARALADQLAEVVDQRPSNSWVETADVLIRVRKYHPTQLASLIRFIAATETLRAKVTNFYMLSQWLDIIITDPRFTEFAVHNGGTFTDQQVAAAQARRAAHPRAGQRPATPNPTPTPTPTPSPAPSSQAITQPTLDAPEEPAYSTRLVRM